MKNKTEDIVTIICNNRAPSRTLNQAVIDKTRTLQGVSRFNFLHHRKYIFVTQNQVINYKKKMYTTVNICIRHANFACNCTYTLILRPYKSSNKENWYQ